MWYHCLTRFIKGFLEGTHFLRPSTFSALEINSFLSGNVLSSFMSNVWWSQWLAGTPERHHSKDEVSSTASTESQWRWLGHVGNGSLANLIYQPEKKKHDYKALMISNQIVTGQNSYCIYPSYLHVCHQDWHIMSVYRHITKWTYLHESYIPN